MSICNLKCKFCYTRLSQYESYLTREHLCQYLRVQLENELILIQKMNFNWRGEPLMNPNFIELIVELEERDLHFPWEFHTNGTLIDDHIAFELVKKLRRGKVFVSIDGGTEISHDLNRGNGTFRRALDGLRRVFHQQTSTFFVIQSI